MKPTIVGDRPEYQTQTYLVSVPIISFWVIPAPCGWRLIPALESITLTYTAGRN